MHRFVEMNNCGNRINMLYTQILMSVPEVQTTVTLTLTALTLVVASSVYAEQVTRGLVECAQVYNRH